MDELKNASLFITGTCLLGMLFCFCGMVCHTIIQETKKTEQKITKIEKENAELKDMKITLEKQLAHAKVTVKTTTATATMSR